MFQHMLDVFKTFLMKVTGAAWFGNKGRSMPPSEKAFSDKEWEDVWQRHFEDECRFLNVVIKFFGYPFKDITDVNLNNIRDLLIPVFEDYRDGRIKCPDTLLNIGEALNGYLHKQYKDDFNIEPIEVYNCDDELCNTQYIHPLDAKDPRSVAVNIIFDMHLSHNTILPEDAPFFIDQLKSPPHEASLANERINQLSDQLDDEERRYLAIEKGLYKLDPKFDCCLKSSDEDLDAAVDKMWEEFKKSQLKTT